jgi:hypothetical protein
MNPYEELPVFRAPMVEGVLPALSKAVKINPERSEQKTTSSSDNPNRSLRVLMTMPNNQVIPLEIK